MQAEALQLPGTGVHQAGPARHQHMSMIAVESHRGTIWCRLGCSAACWDCMDNGDGDCEDEGALKRSRHVQLAQF